LRFPTVHEGTGARNRNGAEAISRERGERIEALRRALVAGDRSGTARPLDFNEIKRKARLDRFA
jgi:hypothetical protein